MTTQRIIQGDCIEGLRTLPDASVHCCVTSPPYWGLRDYGHDGQIGLESTPEAYVTRMVEVFREVRRVLREDGTCWVNLGDSYAATTKGSGGTGKSTLVGTPNDENRQIFKPRRLDIGSLKPKDLVGIPWRVAFALQADGWWLRQDIIWHKPNPMPESVRDRCTKAHEYVFLLTKSERYFYDAEAVKIPGSGQTQGGKGHKHTKEGANEFNRTKMGLMNLVGREWATANRRSVWTVTTKPYSGAHFAVMPPDLVEPCILAGCPDQCCPACGAGYERKREKTGKVLSTGGSENNRRNGHTDFGGSDMNCGTFVQHEWKTLGWQPACDCAATGTIPGTVLDPFAGSGTTLAVAAELGRNAIGCELNPEYIALAERRIKDARSSVALFEGVPV